MRVAVLGATGPIGRRTTRALLDRRVEVRVVSRSPESLARDFGELSVERHPADLQSAAAAVEAAGGCDVLIHAVGLPLEAFGRHLPIARNVAAACTETGSRLLLVTSYWSYGPGDEVPMVESRGRVGVSELAAIRERQEEECLAVGAAVTRLPDFYGREEGQSLLNEALDRVREGKTVAWPGNPDAPRDQLYYEDAGRLLADLVLREEAYGQVWNVPGSGAEPPRSLLEQAARIAGTRLRLRRIRRWMVRLAAVFRRDVRPFLDVMPIYEAPVILETGKLRGLFGGWRTTPYAEALPATLEWLEARSAL